MMRQVALLAVALCATSSLAFLTPPPRPVRSRCGVRDRVLQMSGVERNPNFGKLMGGYLFPEIARRRSAFLEANPEAKIISLGIGDTTQPIPPHILSGLVHGASKLGTPPGYSGYGPDQGVKDLREKIASTLYGNRIDPDDVFVSDGAKCDIGRLQVMFGKNVVTAVQDPSYPVYVDTAVIMGQTGLINEQSRQFDGIVYMPCNPGNDFFPDLAALPQRPDVIYFCSPNNPTGVAATRPQLEALVSYAREQGSVIVFDAAYAPFIRDPSLPKSIFEIEGALECAIEVNSFSKYAGFTGVRLGWTVVPKQLKFRDGSSMHADFNRMMSTTFNGASNIVQDGGLAILDKEGLAEIQTLISYYLANAAKLRATVEAMGYKAYGGDNGPYVYVDLGGKSSWDVFSEILEKAQIVTTPGAGFGPGGEGFLRLSAFASKENVDEACERLQKVMVK
ncbi:LL-diaminopimelate aminotransferase [Nannochloropsis gaditana CCMP526]|uniref:LL-diaminopimelate aminotransferase n=1 Tax=Nannochloropsis gaditana (strain CCMP526) TaxID=1093141 RepID=UPI00029F7BC9|nr:LL-diaminopimelate aminotransferase [Nannochloropsis gaditana CCMP526]EKU20940.1 LL-diaminopimelate aminotransferase [Nannochloropsis gaditana CCMP526]|eukprot:XP_005855409.1 LL-diaminopimelate aminotransferase [Nannochloropsis gaditana CCMP526]